MIFTPEKCRIPDQRMKPFIDPEEIWDIINNTKSDKEAVRTVIAKSLDKQRLTMRGGRLVHSHWHSSLAYALSAPLTTTARLGHGAAGDHDERRGCSSHDKHRAEIVHPDIVHTDAAVSPKFP